MATHALAGTPSSSGARPAAGVAVPGPRPRPLAGLFPAERVLPVLPELSGLFPGGGLPRGGTVLLGPASAPETLLGPARDRSGPGSAMANRRPGLTSLLLLLLAGTSSRGHWCAVAGLPELGLAAAAELGADLDHLVVIPHPGSEGRWQSVVATLLETVDLVCLAPGAPVRPVDARRLAARARERCSTLLVVDAYIPAGAARGLLSGDPARSGRVMARWPGPSDLQCAVRESSWSGLEPGHGLLSSRQLEAEVCGRGAASRPRRGLLRLPA
ncbi:MAG: hypothetical protein ABSB52_02005 [Acidimicrobiales bacterium]|jgi:hypothetical protein